MRLNRKASALQILSTLLSLSTTTLHVHAHPHQAQAEAQSPAVHANPRSNANANPDSVSVTGGHEATLWATHYNGNVYTLSLKGDNLSLTDTKKTCGDMPSWLTFDAESKTLYCSDESGTADPDTHGTLSAYSVGSGGKLNQVAKVDTVGGGVKSVIYEAGQSQKYIAIAHYEGSAVSTFKLPLTKPKNTHAKQALHFTMSHNGSTPQQDSPHPHSVFLDPTGSFLVSPDLGADLLRIYSIDPHSGHLHTCQPVNVTFGSGPRHGLFWTDGTNNETANAGGEYGRPTHERQMAAVGKTMLYLVNEIGGTMMTFDVSYARSGCLDLQLKDTVVPYPGEGSQDGVMPSGATPAEIRMVGDRFYVSIRSDDGFAPNDSIVTLERDAKSGNVDVLGKSDAWGKVPRTMVINRAGDLVAIGNQASSTVAIVRRDRITGDLGEKVAILKVGESGTVGAAEGLSSVIWAE
ncbi:hypothetical protein N7540_012070 [Penicillium herquei]|nr:hypothetical protein N7540_012070 [Penicillium herquei]